jgi:hypothetical protein
MKNLPILTALMFLLALGAMSAARAWQEPPAAEKKAPEAATDAPAGEVVTAEAAKASALVADARRRMFQWQTVQAELVQLVSFGDQPFRSTGLYLAAKPFRYRLEYRVELADLEGKFLEVSDGQVLHIRRQIGEIKPSPTSPAVPEVDLSRRDLQKIVREATPTLGQPEVELAAELGIGGLPAVLASLERSLAFDAVRNDVIEGKEYVVVQGHWKTQRRDQLLMGLGPAAGQIAGFLPDLVRVYFARETLFPEKFVYLKATSPEGKAFRPYVTVEFKNVVLDQPIPDQQFVYVAPPGVEEKDETAMFLDGIRQASQPPAASAAPQNPAAPPMSPAP